MKKTVSLFEKSLASFYDLYSIEFICATNVMPDELNTVYNWMDNYPLYKRNVRFICVPPEFIDSIIQNYSIDYFPEYFLRNIGLRRARGRYMISGSCDAYMPPHFFLASVKHLFFKNIFARTRRVDMIDEKYQTFDFRKHYIQNVKQTKNDYFIPNLKFVYACYLPKEPYPYCCGDYQDFHCEFWIKLNGYLNTYFNVNIDSLLSYRLMGFFNPILQVVSPGELHFSHPFVSNSTPVYPYIELCQMNLRFGEYTITKLRISN